MKYIPLISNVKHKAKKTFIVQKWRGCEWCLA